MLQTLIYFRTMFSSRCKSFINLQNVDERCIYTSYIVSVPVLEECLQPAGTLVWGPVWVSTGESFSPTGSRDFFLAIREAIKSRLKESRRFRAEVNRSLILA